MKRFVARCTPWGTIQTGDYFCLLNEYEKAAVMLHEKAHLRNRDALRRLWWIVSLRIVWDREWVFDRCVEQELAADRYVRERGFGPGMISFLHRFPSGSSALHPSSRQRLEALHG